MTSKKSLLFLNDPGKWPMWPYCPLKRSVDGPSDGTTTQVVLEFATVMATVPKLILIEEKNFRDAVAMANGHWTVLTAEEIVDLGWRVD